MDIRELEDFKLSDAVKFHDKLNPLLWTENGRLDPDVRKQLLVIAEDFITELGIGKLKVEDITISGSNAAYSYTPHSDIDLHILVDIDKFPNDEVYRELFNAKKNEYNRTHDLIIRGIPVELYVQDSEQPHASLGEYSLLKKDWIKFPVKRRANFDQERTRAKYEKLGELIELALKNRNLADIERVLDIVKRYRKAGLTKTGEFGPENLAFKAIRKHGLFQALWDMKQELHSERLSLANEMGEDYDPNGPPPGPEFKPTMPQGTVRVDVSDVYDWYKLGQHISNLKGLGKHDFGKGPPSTILSFGDEDLEHKYIDALKKTGLDVTDIDPAFHKDKKDIKTDPTYKVDEVLDTPAKGIKWDTEDPELITGKFTASNNIKYGIDILAPYIGPDELDPHDFFSSEQMTDEFYDRARFVEFEQVTRSYKGKQGVEGTGSAAEVFGIVVNGLLSYIKKYKPSMLYFQAVESNRQKLYKTISERVIRSLPGWQFEQKGSHFAIYNSKLLKKDKVKEASGYIPSEKEKNDPRFKTALTVDVKPNSIKKNAKAFGWSVSRSGIPPLLRK